MSSIMLRAVLLATMFWLGMSHDACSRTPLDRGKRIMTSASASDYEPEWCGAQHNVGSVVFEVANDGTFGASLYESSCIPGLPWISSGYPKGAHASYNCYGALWVGGVRDDDTLVSTGYDGWSWNGWEFTPDEAPLGRIEYRSIIDPTEPAYKGARSEQDFIAHYSDTIGGGTDWWNGELDFLDKRPHRPLQLAVTQTSYAWSYPYADDFILENFEITNTGLHRLWGVYLGLYVDGDVFQWWEEGGAHHAEGADDDICGFLESSSTSYGGCNWIDTVDLAWWADNDGDFQKADNLIEAVPHVAGIRIVNTPGDSLQLSFNWWSSSQNPALDWGPQTKKNFRNLQTGGLGTPLGDRNKYHYLRNGEFDYDQIYTAQIRTGDSAWLYPNQAVARDLSQGQDTRFLLSCGPFSIEPGQSLPVTFAFVMGKYFHRDPDNGLNNLIEGYNPDSYYENVDFSDIVTNAQWASWIYDNPGFDTDGDGYAGKYRLCCTDSIIQSIDSTVTPWDTVWTYRECEKIYYEGDGVPDYRGASPPPAPKFWLKPGVRKITVRWNGTYSETTKDIFLQKIDFEGYRVYYSLDARENSCSLLASYDHENYDKYVWKDSRSEWEITDIPLTLNECRCLYGESCGDSSFHPLDYPRGRPYFMSDFSDSIFYFAPHDFNQYELGATTPIHKVYPDQPYPSAIIPDSADASELTDDGLFKYYEYEMTIDNILPTIRYYVNVTAFDYGSPKSGLMALETSKTLNPKITYGLPDGQDVVEKNLKAYVYPNPYRIDGDYLDKGFEGRDAQYYIPERLRRIHFANLPPRCTISIFTLDGDLVRRLDHDKDPFDPAASHDTWDLITRNTQAVVSGIYYWTVEQPSGQTQIGKLVIIK